MFAPPPPSGINRVRLYRRNLQWWRHTDLMHTLRDGIFVVLLIETTNIVLAKRLLHIAFCIAVGGTNTCIYHFISNILHRWYFERGRENVNPPPPPPPNPGIFMPVIEVFGCISSSQQSSQNFELSLNGFRGYFLRNYIFLFKFKNLLWNRQLRPKRYITPVRSPTHSLWAFRCPTSESGGGGL